MMTFLFKNPFDGELHPIQNTPDDIFSHKLLEMDLLLTHKMKRLLPQLRV